MSSDPGGLGLTFEVGPQDLATALGSGDVPVLATPRLIAWLEAACVAVATERLEAGQTSVGTRVAVEHTAAVGVGAAVRVWATLAHTDGKVLQFDCGASTVPDGDPAARPLASGQITRAVVDRAHFASRWG